MHATAPAPVRFRGIVCRHCKRPVRLPASLVVRENIVKQAEPNLTQQWGSRIFPLRCKTCGGESIYALDQIDSFADAQNLAL